MKLPIIFIAAILAVGTNAKATVVINLGTGILANAVGMAIPNGALIQLIISSTDTVFSAPTASSFIGNSSDDVFISFAQDSTTTGFAGANAESVSLTYSGSIGASDQILLRWYPTLTTASTSPGAGTFYGEFRTNTSGVDGSTIAWTLPSDGSTPSLNFNTQSIGGSRPNSDGYATTSVVPEPSSLGMALLGFGGFLVNMRFRRPRAA